MFVLIIATLVHELDILFQGGHINDAAYLEREGINRHSVSTMISQMYADMIFR